MKSLDVYRDINGKVYDSEVKYKFVVYGSAARLLITIMCKRAVEYSFVCAEDDIEGFKSAMMKLEVSLQMGVCDVSIFVYYIRMVSVYAGILVGDDKHSWLIEFKDSAFYPSCQDLCNKATQFLDINDAKLAFVKFDKASITYGGKKRGVTRCYTNAGNIGLEVFNESDKELTLSGKKKIQVGEKSFDTVKACDYAYNMFWR